MTLLHFVMFFEDRWDAWFYDYLPYIQMIGEDFHELKPEVEAFFYFF